MSTEFLKSNPALDAAIENATDAESIREIVKSNLASRGIIERERGNDFGAQLIPGYRPEPESDVSLSASGYKYEKEIRFAESTGKRALLIRANTPEDLAALEKQVVGE
jgi:hypothetical protein